MDEGDCGREQRDGGGELHRGDAWLRRAGESGILRRRILKGCGRAINI